MFRRRIIYNYLSIFIYGNAAHKGESTNYSIVLTSFTITTKSVASLLDINLTISGLRLSLLARRVKKLLNPNPDDFQHPCAFPSLLLLWYGWLPRPATITPSTALYFLCWTPAYACGHKEFIYDHARVAAITARFSQRSGVKPREPEHGKGAGWSLTLRLADCRILQHRRL